LLYNIVMKKVTLGAFAIALLPAVTHAQSLQEFFPNLVTFVSNVVIPFLLGIAFLLFAINVVRFFILGGSSEEGREKAKALAIYSIAAFVLIIVFWGIINLLVSSLGFANGGLPTSDYACPSGLCGESQMPPGVEPYNPCTDPTNPSCQPGRV